MQTSSADSEVAAMQASDSAETTLPYGDDLQALLALAQALEGYRISRSQQVSTSLILFALALSAYAPAAWTQLGAPAAAAFSSAMKALAGARFHEAWTRYFKTGIDQLVLPAARRMPDPNDVTENCRSLLTMAARLAQQAQRPQVALQDLIQAMGALPNMRFNRVLMELGVSMRELFASYEKFLLSGVVSALADQTIFKHLVHDHAGTLDLMDFGQYAQAIASFLTSPATEGPISISIQAPWGAGKSSLMHQVRELLDPEPRARPKGLHLRTRGVLQLLRGAGAAAEREVLPVVAGTQEQQEKRWTIWFNAWKYESSEQMWAGLADAIVTQVSERMSLEQRELFFLRLNLARIDDGKVRQKLHDRVVAYWWAGARWLLLAALATPAAAIALPIPAEHVVAGGSGLLALGLMAMLARAWKTVEAEPATFSLAEYVRVPDYDKSVGMIHHIHQDLQRVIGLLPVRKDSAGMEQGTAPLVIFIDDLDRCAPGKVASIVEGINTFLASDQREFMFVIGMDPQIVAAALEHAHKDVKTCLPVYEQNVPLGWRFMDKFIQLAFTIPPRRAAAIARYVGFLTEPGVPGKAPVADPPGGVGNGPAEGAGGSTPPAHALAEPEPAAEADSREAALASQRIASRAITNESADVGTVMRAITGEFVSSPREIKRILNFVRFVLLLRLARIEARQDVPTLDVYQRWIVLCIRWPDMARWLQWGGELPPPSASDPISLDLTARRLTSLEQAAGPADQAIAAWAQGAAQRVGLPCERVSWLSDPDLHRFFVRENALAPTLRLSHGAAIGFY